MLALLHCCWHQPWDAYSTVGKGVKENLWAPCALLSLWNGLGGWCVLQMDAEKPWYSLCHFCAAGCSTCTLLSWCATGDPAVLTWPYCASVRLVFAEQCNEEGHQDLGLLSSALLWGQVFHCLGSFVCFDKLCSFREKHLEMSLLVLEHKVWAIWAVQ